MKNHRFITNILVAVVAFALTSCKDYLTELQPGATELENFYVSGTACVQNATGCYTPLMWEYNYTYYSEWFIGDIVSDDALKGGQNTNDMAAVYDMENWKTNVTNALLLDYYRAQYLGIARCNLALKYIPGVPTDDTMDQKLKDRLIGEVEYLRAFYYFRLLRVFGGVPLSLSVIDTESGWSMPRATPEQVFNQICADLEDANKKLWKKSEYEPEDLGRATKGAAQAMLQKVRLYMASPYWAAKIASSTSKDNYEASKQWGDSVMLSGEYSLCPKYFDNFTLAGENGPESVFEIQYGEFPWSDYGGANGEGGNGYTAGTFTPVLTRSRSNRIGGGWGFNKPTYNLYYEYEDGDARRDSTILNPAKALIAKPAEEIYLGDTLLSRKYALYTESPVKYNYHASRGPINNKQIRYADVLLMHAEAALALGDNAAAESDLNLIRDRAGLKHFGEYSFKVNGKEIAAPTLEQALRHERRVELAMEGHRWFDIVRWGNAKAHMEAYQATENEDVKLHLSVFTEGVHELFPIPAEERVLNPALEQNPGY